MDIKANDAKLYFVTGSFSGAGAVKVMNADGSNERTLATGSDVIEPDGIEVDIAGGKIYWTDMGLGGAADKSVAINDGRIMRSDLDGQNVETLVPTGITTTPKQLALDVPGGKVYWSDRGDVADKNVNPKIRRSYNELQEFARHDSGHRRTDEGRRQSTEVFACRWRQSGCCGLGFCQRNGFCTDD